MNKKYSTETSKRVTLENNHLKLGILPGVGGKIVGLTCKRTGTQFLLKAATDKPDHGPAFGAEFGLHFAYGFDDCFPTVASDIYELNGNEVDLPDHGEVWSRPWKYTVISKTSLELSIEGIGLKYVLTKKIQLIQNEILIEYNLKNESSTGFHYLWSAHPLLKVEKDDQILLGDEVETVNIYWASDDQSGEHGTKMNWPLSKKDGESINYSKVQGKGLNRAVKLFTSRLSVPTAVLYKPRTDESLVFSYDSHTSSYLGLWLCYEGWPEHSEKKSFTVALEPCSSPSDMLSEAVKSGKAVLINAGISHDWSLKIRCVEGKEKIS